MDTEERAAIAALRRALSDAIVAEVKRTASEGDFSSGEYTGPLLPDSAMQRANVLLALDRYQNAIDREV